MAQAQSDLFKFLITPEFDTKDVTDSAQILEKELEKVAEKISTQISTAMGKGFSFPAGFQPKDIDQVTKYVETLGGSVKRVGTTITSSFKDASGTVKTLKQNIEGAVEAARNASISAMGGNARNIDIINAQYEGLRASSATYTGVDQVKQQNELEQQIIKSVQERYNLEEKIIDAKASGNTANEAYYTQLRNIAVTEEQQLQLQYQGSQENIAAKKQQLNLEQQLYQQKVNSQTADKQSAQTEQNNLKRSLELLNQYESVKSKIDSAEASGQKGSAYYQELETQLKDIIASMQAYGIEVDKTTGKLVFKDTAANAVKAKENVGQLNKELKETNTTLDTQKAKAKDQTLINSIKEYVKQYKALQSLEASGKQDTQAYKDTQAAMQTLIQTLKQYGIEIQTDANGTQQFVVVQKTQENQTDKVNSVLREQNTVLAQSGEKQNTFSKSIQDSVENFIKYQVAMEAINKLTSEFTSAIYDMNEAMTQVRMVTMGSYEDTVQLADSYTQLAKQLGTTTTTVAEGADTWLNV